ncbi:hypothetical protein [Devosia sp. Leaf420]|nr:hypothetical protein [Devosia sp. Leaf420]
MQLAINGHHGPAEDDPAVLFEDLGPDNEIGGSVSFSMVMNMTPWALPGI